ncbi:hypothetical protein [Microseira wollei]|nr:hypothetical protein [Microseira wollei]
MKNRWFGGGDQRMKKPGFWQRPCVSPDITRDDLIITPPKRVWTG